MNRIVVIFQFYRLFLAWSIIVTGILIWLGSNHFTALFTKLFLIGLAWYFMQETTNRRQFTFYKNLGISPRFLFTGVFIIDSVLTVAILLLFN